MSTHSEHSSRHYVSTFLLALLFMLAAMLLMGQKAVQPADDPVDGKEIFENTCATCHTVQPPPNLAPPMAMIVRHYRMALADSSAVKEALVSWVESPDTSKSLLPAHAIERFGLMAPLALNPEEINAVVDYVMTLKPEMGGRGMMDGGIMGGMQSGGMKSGMMDGGMMKMDSTATGMTCPRMDSTATGMDCPRLDSTSTGKNRPHKHKMGN